MPKRTKDFSEMLYEDLRDSEFALQFLTAFLDDPEASEADFLRGLFHVVSANGLRGIAEAKDMSATSLYKALSGQRSPQLKTITRLLDALGLRLAIARK